MHSSVPHDITLNNLGYGKWRGFKIATGGLELMWKYTCK